MPLQTEKPIVRSASRALDVIEYLVKAPKAPSFTMIQRATAIPKSSLSYLLQELLQRQYIQFDADMKTYMPGIQLVRIAVTCVSSTNLSIELWRGIKQLSEAVGETTHATILEDRFAIFIAKHSCTNDVSSVLNIGFRLGAHATACGKVMLASLTQDKLNQLFKGVDLEKYTPYTMTSYDKLYRELHRIRKYGIAFDYQGNVLGGFCIAAPVRDKEGKVVAAVSVSIFSTKVRISYLRFLIRHVREVAQAISLRLGYMDYSR